MTLLLRPDQLSWAVDLINDDQAVGLPTETVYGLAGVATSAAALARVFALKARPNFDPLIVHVRDYGHALELARDPSPLHERLCREFWPGPLTLLFEKRSVIPDLCTAGTPWVAMRSPKHPVFREVLERTRQALAAPSANRFGRISPTEAQHVIDELGPFGLEAVVDGGPCQWGLESTVVKLHGDRIEVVRLGAVGLEDLRRHASVVEIRPSGTGQREEAPGQLASHYAPRAPLYLHEAGLEWSEAKDAVLLSVFSSPADLQKLPWKRAVMLSEKGSDIEAASRLFKTLRELDDLKPRFIVGVLSSREDGLSPAINDRLRRASCISPRRHEKPSSRPR